MRVTLSTRALAVGTILTKSGLKGCDAGVDAVEVLGGVEVVMADDEGDAGVAEVLQVGLLEGSADSSSRSARWKPASAALVRTSSSAATEPANLPPLAARRQVAMAVAAVLSAKNCLNFGRASEGLLEVVEAELEEGSLLDDGGGLFDHLGGRGADDGDADFGDAGTEELRDYCWHIRSHSRIAYLTEQSVRMQSWLDNLQGVRHSSLGCE